MAPAAESIRQLTRAYVGARVYQGLLFWFALVHNVNAVLPGLGYPNPRLQMWIALGAILAAATLGTYYRWRFGRVEPQRPAPSRRPFEDFKYGVLGGTAFALLVMAAVWAVFVGGREAGVRPLDLVWLLLSAGVAMSLAASRGDRLATLLPVLASIGLLLTLAVPVFQPYRIVGHAGMAAALTVTAVQLHLFLMRGFRHVHV